MPEAYDAGAGLLPSARRGRWHGRGTATTSLGVGGMGAGALWGE
eukprot:CAMPEP_0204354548 /NCGR_PEP_ID=MMETSP0469-20131031/33487_1 /ASSEMBLY_ACC=CAM_ASM_000384 /TAXON_ID=2969 /ORGANISM="Oxyrrhis marina" /LENGTH=43 /DNA_ID= /DNA_START= /DNA_END= /DNA_ORIENTATION=